MPLATHWDRCLAQLYPTVDTAVKIAVPITSTQHADGSQVYKVTQLKRQVSAFIPTLFWVPQYDNRIFINLCFALTLLMLESWWL